MTLRQIPVSTGGDGWGGGDGVGGGGTLSMKWVPLWQLLSVINHIEKHPI